MKKVLSEIQDGTFASEFIQEFNAGGKARFLATRKKEADHLLCKVGAELRNMMSWLKKQQQERNLFWPGRALSCFAKPYTWIKEVHYGKEK